MGEILDSGNRMKFETGAVRDIQKGKGRCDLLPLDVVEQLSLDKIIGDIAKYQNDGDLKHLASALGRFTEKHWGSPHTMLLEVSKHFEDGCEKYGENNWRKGIPSRCYINSAVRHYLKWLRGDDDEPHDRAFCWNLLCCIWTCQHLPGLNDYAKEANHDT